MRPAGSASGGALLAVRINAAWSGTTADRAVRRLAYALLMLAARRQPEPIRADLALEWTSELHAIVHDGARCRLYRTCWALLYAVSLALTAALRQGRVGATSGATRRKYRLIAAIIFLATLAAIGAAARAADQAAAAALRAADATVTTSRQEVFLSPTCAIPQSSICGALRDAYAADALNDDLSTAQSVVEAYFTCAVHRYDAATCNARTNTDAADRDAVFRILAVACVLPTDEALRDACGYVDAVNRADAATDRAASAADADRAFVILVLAVFVVFAVKLRRARRRLRL